MYVQADAGAKQHPRGRDDHQTGGQSLKRACNDLFHGEPGNIHRRQQAILDFAGELKFPNQRHSHGPDSGAHHANGHDSWQ